MKKTAVITISFLFSLYFAEVGHAAPPAEFVVQRLNLSADMQYYFSNENFDDNGEAFDLLQSNSYNVFITAYKAQYFLSERLAIQGGFGYSYATSEGLTETRTNGALTDLRTGLEGHFDFSSFAIRPDINLLFALQEINPNDDKVFTSEGVNSYQVGSSLSYRISPFLAYSYLGYQYRAEGRSHLLPWQLGLAWQFQDVEIFAELNGYESVRDDDDSDDLFNEITRRSLNANVNAGSSKFYSLNPRLMTAQLGLSYILTDQLKLGGSYAVDIAGENMAKGQALHVSILYAWDFSEPNLDNFIDKLEGDLPRTKKQRGKPKIRSTPRKVSPQFKPKVEEDYNDAIFRDDEEI